MDQEGNPGFSIIEEPFYTQNFARLVRDPVLRDDIQLIFERDVIRDPYIFEEISFTKYRAVTIACLPPLTIYFRIDAEDKIIYLSDVQRIP